MGILCALLLGYGSVLHTRECAQRGCSGALGSDPLLHVVTVSPRLFLLAFSVSSELSPSPSPSSCLKSFQFLQVFPLGGNLKKDSDLQGCCKTLVSDIDH